MTEEVMQFSDAWDFPLFKETSLSEKQWKQLKEDIGETEEKKAKSLQRLILKLNNSGLKHFNPCLDETFLLGFLRVCKYDVSKAYDRMIRFYRQLKKQCYEFQTVSDSAVKKTKWFRHGYISPCRLKDNSILIITKPFVIEPDEISYDEVFFLDYIIYIQLMMHSTIQLSGITVIADLSNLTFQKIMMYTPSRIQTYVNVFQSTFPCRFKGVHLVNANIIFTTLYRMVFPLLSKKMRSRISAHGSDINYKSLHGVIPPELLPEEYGGSIKQSDMIDMISTSKQMSVEFQKLSNFGFTSKHNLF